MVGHGLVAQGLYELYELYYSRANHLSDIPMASPPKEAPSTRIPINNDNGTTEIHSGWEGE